MTTHANGRFSESSSAIEKTMECDVQNCNRGTTEPLLRLPLVAIISFRLTTVQQTETMDAVQSNVKNICGGFMTLLRRPRKNRIAELWSRQESLRGLKSANQRRFFNTDPLVGALKV